MGSIGQGISRVVGYATQVALARMYGPAALGLYVLGVTVVSIANLLSQFGMDNGVVRYVAHYRAENDVARMRGIIWLALWTAFGLSMAFGAAVFFGAPLIAEGVFSKPSLEGMLRVFAVALPFLTVMSMALWAIQGFQTVRYPTYVRQIIQPSANLALVCAFYLLGAQVIGAAAAYVLSMVTGSVLGFYYLRRTFPKLLDRSIPAKYEPRALYGASGPMIVANVTQYVNTWTTVAVLGIFAAAEVVGIYNVAARTAALSSLVLFAFTGIFSPMVSSLYRQGSLEHLGSLFKDVSRWTFTGSLACFLLTVFLAKDIMAVFGEAFVSGWWVMVMIATAQLFSSSVGLTSRILAMTGHQKMVMYATIGSTIVGLAASLALIPTFGLAGAAVATSAAIVVSNGTTLYSVRKLLGFWPYTRWYLKSAAAGLLAAGLSYLLELALPLAPGLITVLVISPIFLLVFAALLFALGLSPSDRQFLSTFRASVRRALGRGR